MARLTAISVENIKPAPVRREIPDSGCRGLYLVVQPSGKKSWAVRYRFGGKPKKLTLTGGLTLAAARKAATDALHALEQGRDPAALKLADKISTAQAAADLAADTVEHHAALFLAHQRRKTREVSWKQTQHVLDNIALPAWRGRAIHDIRRRDVIDLVEKVAEDRPIMANRALAHLSRFFSWLCERDIVTASPCAGVKPPSAEHARERILGDEEIKRLWTTCDAIGGRAGPCIKLMLLTGQRHGEVAGMRRSELTGDVWTLLPERTKNKRHHEVPLSAQALAIIAAMPLIAGDEDFVFTSGRSRRLGNLSHAKATIDLHMQSATPWVLHDLRRTSASGMAKLGIRLPVIEKCLNHAGGSFRGIVGVYQRHDFAAEKRDALQRWADHVDAIVRGEPTGKIVKLRG